MSTTNANQTALRALKPFTEPVMLSLKPDFGGAANG